MLDDSNIVDYTVSQTELELTRKGIDANVDTIAEILSVCKDIPYVSSFYKLGKFLGGVKELFFVKRLARFLSHSDSIPFEKKKEFVDGMTHKDKEKVSEFLLHALYNSNNSTKCDVLGLIYKRRILLGFDKARCALGMSDNNILLRLCYGVDTVYADNLLYLPKYSSAIENDGVSSEDLLRAGFLAVHGKPTRSIPYTPVDLYSLSILGSELLDILSEAEWFADNC